MYVIDCEEIQRCRHLCVQNIKQHRFKHQDKSDEHFVASGFIQTKRFTEEENDDHNRQDDQHQVGDFYVMHQPGAEENHGDGADQYGEQITEAQRLMVWL